MSEMDWSRVVAGLVKSAEDRAHYAETCKSEHDQRAARESAVVLHELAMALRLGLPLHSRPPLRGHTDVSF